MAHDVDRLHVLARLAHDALHAYASALDRVRDGELRATLEELRLDHERHLSDLTTEILARGGVPPRRGDLRGPWLQALAALSAMLGDTHALRALARAEEAVLHAYARLLAGRTAEPATEHLREALRDQLRHLAQLRELVSTLEHAGELRA